MVSRKRKLCTFVTVSQKMTLSHFFKIRKYNFINKSKESTMSFDARRSFRIFGVLFSVFLIGCLSIQAQTPITLEKALELSVLQNKSIESALLGIKKSDATVKEAYSNTLPSVTVSGSYNYNVMLPVFFLPSEFAGQAPGGFVAVSAGAPNGFNTTAQVTQILFNAAVFKAISASERYSQISIEQYKATVSKSLLATEKAFYGALLAKEFYEVTKASLANGEANLDNVRIFLKQGLVAEFDEMRASVGVENIRPIVIQAEATKLTAYNGLKLAMGKDIKEDISVEGTLDYTPEKLPSEQEMYDMVINSNYDLKSLEMQMNVSKDMVALKETEYYPTVAAFANYQYLGAGNNLGSMNTAQSSAVGIQVQMSLFNGFGTQARVQQAEIDAKTLASQQDLLRQSLLLQSNSLQLQIRSAEQRILGQQKNVEQAERAYEISNIRYKSGLGSQIEISDSDVALRQARLNKVQAIHDYKVAVAELKVLIGSVNPRYFEYKK